MIFDLLAPPQGPRGWGPKNCAVACAIDVSYSHTKFGWISEKKFFGPLNPPWYPQVRHLGHDPGDWMKFLSDIRRHTKFGLKILEIDFVIEF